MEPARLITIAFSHYCEKARWALDFAKIEYREEAHAPMKHRRPMRAAGGTTVPVLVHNGRAFRDSSEIVLYAQTLAPAEQGLLPVAEKERARVLAMEDEFDETLGVDARLLAYYYFLRDLPHGRTLVARMMGLRWNMAQSVVALFLRKVLFRRYGINAKTVSQSEKRVRALFAKLGDTLEKERYLASGQFTIADLTFAALSAPLLGPPEHPVSGRLQDRLPPALSALRAELSNTVAGRHALRMYREHRTRASA